MPRRTSLPTPTLQRRVRHRWPALLPLLVALPAAVPAPTPERAGACHDPWMTRAVREVTGRAPRGEGDAGECDLRLYGARWGSYAELRAQVGAAHAALRAAGLEHDAGGGALHEPRGSRTVSLRAAYLGPRRRAPARQVVVTLPRDHVLAFDWPAARPVAPGGPSPAAARTAEPAPPSHPEQTR